MEHAESRTTAPVLDARIDALGWDQALERITRWARQRESRYVCLCNVHSVVTAHLDPGYRAIVNAADMATPDGMPVAWALTKLGFPRQQRINGPDLMWRLCERAGASGERMYFYGGSQPTLALLSAKLESAFPKLAIAGMESPPYRALSDQEVRETIERINSSGAAIVFVGLGCPKQERWMAQQRGKICAVMIGVGAAFDYHAGTLKRAPPWMQDNGLEWLYRLVKEPRRLWRRYLVTNAIFVLRIAGQLLTQRARMLNDRR
jgi:N-acetylglucosaminyldiphosphoundecaprenol N-acetyl-beta-D-mannosaminyltransferase